MPEKFGDGLSKGIQPEVAFSSNCSYYPGMGKVLINLINKPLLAAIILTFTLAFPLRAQLAKQTEMPNRTFLQSTIRFDNTSLKKIVLYPEAILDNPDNFWDNDSAYKLYKLWHQLVSYPIDMEQWKKNLQSYVAVPYLYSFLPKDCPPIDATVYFTTAIMANGFQMNDDVVIYGENSDKENLFIHELFHRCQRVCESINDKKETENPELDQICLLLWIEGTATYVGYKALHEFPSVDPLLQNDYRLIGDTANIIGLRQKLNALFCRIASNSIDKNELQGNLIQTGVVERAFYIVGFDMASTIDEKLGREAWKETLLKGPEYFIQKYNSLVNDNRKVVDLYSTIKLNKK